LILAAASVLGAATLISEGVGLWLAATRGGVGGMTLATAALLGRAVVSWVAAAGVVIFCRGIARLGFVKLAALAATMFLLSAIAGTVQAVGASFPPQSFVLNAIPGGVAAAILVSMLGSLAFLATAWRVEHAMRTRSTGWAWAFACALVVSLGVWRLPVAPPPSALTDYVSYVRVAPLATLVSYSVIVASTAFLAVPCLLLRRRLATALPVPPVAASPPPVRILQIHAASLEGKLALAMGVGALGCLVLGGSALRHGSAFCGPNAVSFEPAYGWERVFFVGDVALDLVVLLAAARFVRETTALQWLIGSLFLRAPLLVDAGHRLSWSAVLVCALPGAVLALVAHLKIGTWLGGRVEPYSHKKTRAAYRDATRFLIGALSVLALTAFWLGSSTFYVVLAAPTVIVAGRVLRRHADAALELLEEAAKVS
jgi:hypothetical protein